MIEPASDEMVDVVSRKWSLIKLCGLSIEIHALIARIRQQDAEIERMRTALEPFANDCKCWVGFEDSEHLVDDWPDGPIDLSLTVGDLRRAAAALKGGDA